MQLCPEFELLWGQLFHRSPLFMLDVALKELMVEETCPKELSTMFALPSPIVFAASCHSLIPPW